MGGQRSDVRTDAGGDTVARASRVTPSDDAGTTGTADATSASRPETSRPQISERSSRTPAGAAASAPDEVEGHARPKWHAVDEEPAEGTDDVEGHARPKWHAIEDEPAAESTDDKDDVEGHIRPTFH